MTIEVISRSSNASYLIVETVLGIIVLLLPNNNVLDSVSITALQSFLVFATHCVPARFGLNGRKVIAWILWMVKMMKN